MQILNREFNEFIVAFFDMTGCLVLPEGVEERISYLIDEVSNHLRKHKDTVYSLTAKRSKMLLFIWCSSPTTTVVQTDLRR